MCNTQFPHSIENNLFPRNCPTCNFKHAMCVQYTNFGKSAIPLKYIGGQKHYCLSVHCFFQTLMRSYLLKLNGQVAERPQQMLMRVAVGIHHEDIDAAIETYNLLSEKWFTHASPTLFNAGTCRPQLSSCFLLTMADDSIEGIYDTLRTCALISKSAGGIGLNVHNIRASGSYIAGVRVPFLFWFSLFYEVIWCENTWGRL